MSRLQLIHVLSKEKTDSIINNGRIDNNKLHELNNLIPLVSFDEYFICGPEEMIFCVKSVLEEKQIEKKKIHFELFGNANQKLKTQSQNIEPLSNFKSAITVKVDGRSFDFNITDNAVTLLDAALQQGADLPYACKGGMCCTCKAKLLEGKVQMDVHYGLEDEEIEQGYILTCQSHPVSEKVIVDYDIK
jgi:ring-1,2-phenylacetyl-CoA epoxidase subunit PaaE